MSSQEISLKWNGYQSNILSNVKELFNDERLTDVTLVSGGQSFKAHKVILSANSSVFKNIFQQNHYENPIIVLHDINTAALRTILSFVYNGEVNVTEEFLPILLKTAESLRICGLSTGYDVNKEDEKVATFTKPKKRKKSEQEDNNNKIKKPSSNTKLEPILKPDPIIDSDKTNASIIKVEPLDSPLTDYSEGTNDTDIAFVDDCLDKKYTAKPEGLTCNTVTPSEKHCKKWINEVSSTQPCLNVVNHTDESGVEDDKDSIEIDKEIETVLQSGTIVESLNIATDALSSVPNEVLACKDKNAYYANPSFPCPFCPRIYYSWGYRRRHVKSKHTNDKLTCKWCLLELNSTGSWYAHTTKVHGMPHEEARNSLVVMVEAHAVLTLNEPSVAQLLGQVNIDDSENNASEKTKNKE